MRLRSLLRRLWLRWAGPGPSRLQTVEERLAAKLGQPVEGIGRFVAEEVIDLHLKGAGFGTITFKPSCPEVVVVLCLFAEKNPWVDAALAACRYASRRQLEITN